MGNKQWKISAAVSVERMPTITPALTEMEEKLQNLFQELENEQSLKSDHEMRIIEEMLVYIHLFLLFKIRFFFKLIKSYLMNWNRKGKSVRKGQSSNPTTS